MMYVIFNNDGSINTLIVGESINQGSNNVNKIFATVLGYDVVDYSCVGEFELPNGDLVELNGSVDTQTIGDQEYNGYTISLSENVTLYAGNLKLNLKLVDISENILTTYQVTLKVNPTGYQPNDTHITEAQYNALLSSLNSYLLKINFQNIIASYYNADQVDSLLNLKANKTDVYDKTESYSQTEVNNLLNTKQNNLTAGAGITIAENGTISATTAINLVYVASFSDLPSTGALNTIYLIAAQSTEPNNNYDEYIWDSNNSRYEKIGTISTEVDLSNVIKIITLTGSETLADLITNYGSNFSFSFKIGTTTSYTYTIGVQTTHTGYCAVEIENKASPARWVSSDIATSTTIASLMTDTYSKSYLTELDNAPTENSNNAVKSGGVYTALGNKQDNIYEHKIVIECNWQTDTATITMLCHRGSNTPLTAATWGESTNSMNKGFINGYIEFNSSNKFYMLLRDFYLNTSPSTYASIRYLDGETKKELNTASLISFTDTVTEL